MCAIILKLELTEYNCRPIWTCTCPAHFVAIEKFLLHDLTATLRVSEHVNKSFIVFYLAVKWKSKKTWARDSRERQSNRGPRWTSEEGRLWPRRINCSRPGWLWQKDFIFCKQQSSNISKKVTGQSRDITYSDLSCKQVYILSLASHLMWP